MAEIANASTSEARTMPSDHRLRLHDDEDVGPSRPQALQSDPEKSIDTVQGRTRPFPFEDGDLLPESENFKRGVASTSQEDADGSEETEYAFQHELTVVTWRNVASVDNRLKGAGSLILEAQNVLATDRAEVLNIEMSTLSTVSSCSAAETKSKWKSINLNDCRSIRIFWRDRR